LICGVTAILLNGDYLSISSLARFVAVFGVNVITSTIMTSHYQYLVEKEKISWGITTVAIGV
jgi:Cu/Ag efflux pump CusA